MEQWNRLGNINQMEWMQKKDAMGWSIKNGKPAQTQHVHHHEVDHLRCGRECWHNIINGKAGFYLLWKMKIELEKITWEHIYCNHPTIWKLTEGA